MKKDMENVLVKGEEIVIQAKISIIPTIVWIIISLLACFGGIVFGLLIFVLFGCKPLLGYLSNSLIITNKRVYGITGIIKKEELDIPINKVNAISVSNTLLGGILGYKKVKITSMGDGWLFNYVTNANEIKRTFYEMQE